MTAHADAFEAEVDDLADLDVETSDDDDDAIACDSCGGATTDPRYCGHFDWCPECDENTEGCNRCATEGRVDTRCGL